MNVTSLVHGVQRRLRLHGLMASSTAGLAALAAATALSGLLLGAPLPGAAAGLLVGVAITAAGARRAWAASTPLATAGVLEARLSGFDNLLVTAVELGLHPPRASDRMRAEVERQASERAAAVSPAAVVPLRAPTVTLLVVMFGTVVMVWSAFGLSGQRSSDSRLTTPVVAAALTRVTTTVTPPAYLNAAAQTSVDPEQVTMTAGSTLRIVVMASAPLAWLEDAASGKRPLQQDAAGQFFAEWLPDVSGAVVVAAGTAEDVAEHSRVLRVTVVPDEAPRARITAPGRDLAFTTPEQKIEVVIEAEDSEGLRDLQLRYTRLSGSGESFEFAEGQVPIEINRISAGRWSARAAWSLQSAGLQDGDSLVYRAMVRDNNPDSDWVSSESFTIDIGKRLEFAGAGSAVPDEDRRYAISQQMVIMKTERLQAERPKRTAEDWTEQTRFLAIEQRMVRSEVVFLSGGEVEDEVEEAAHSHELQEGRLENAGRAEMLRAMNDMSRAEASLNAGDTVTALVHERAALQALQRAFDRRRYFLRTMPERARIDLSRRLSGDRESGKSFTRPTAPELTDVVATERALIADLVAADQQGVPPGLLARLAAFDADDPTWRAAVAALASADSPQARRAAAQTAMNLLTARARGKLAPSSLAPTAVDKEALRGWWSDESRRRR